MSELVSQIPNTEGLPLLDVTDQYHWAYEPAVREQWIRRFGQQFGIDTDRYVLGLQLGTIIGDDLGAFGSQGYHEENAPYVKQSIMTRINWEISSGTLPFDIVSRLVAVGEILQGIHLETPEGYKAGRNEWMRQIWDYTNEQIAKKPELNDAHEYYLKDSSGINEFISEHFVKPIEE